MKKTLQPIMTPSEELRARREKDVCELYIELSREHPDYAPHRIMGGVARQVRLTVSGVRSILLRKKVYKPTKH